VLLRSALGIIRWMVLLRRFDGAPRASDKSLADLLSPHLVVAGRFLTAQFAYLPRTLELRGRWYNRLRLGYRGVKLLTNYALFESAVRFSRNQSRADSRTCVLILLSHNRPQNLPLLVGSALRSPFINSIVVSNSNPAVRIADWVSSSDSRVVLIDEREPTSPGHRFVLASRQGGRYFMSVDDDIILRPRQLADLFDRLVGEDQVPHGLAGSIYRAGTSATGRPFEHVRRMETEVDILVGAFAFTREHLERLMELVELLRLGDLTSSHNEDILLSFSGISRPRIHDLGIVLRCYSDSLPGIALWKTRPNFFDDRVCLFRRARNARLSMGSRWPSEVVVKD
jgi:hypothetical protein